jgi:RNA polymerase sigma factor (sigma-70 family)
MTDASNEQHVTSPVVALQTTARVSEPDLIARVLSGDRIAARELYDAHSSRVYRLAFRLTGDADLAREFTQDTFVRAFSQLARFRGDAALSTWLHRITVTVVANAMRKVKRFRERETDLEDVHPISSDGAGVDPVLRERRGRERERRHDYCHHHDPNRPCTHLVSLRARPFDASEGASDRVPATMGPWS